MAVLQRPPANGFTREGPAPDEIRIIGVELAIRDEYGQEHELQMFACQHTMTRPGYHVPDNVRVTLHTSCGDYTLRGFIR